MNIKISDEQKITITNKVLLLGFVLFLALLLIYLFNQSSQDKTTVSPKDVSPSYQTPKYVEDKLKIELFWRGEVPKFFAFTLAP